MNEKILKIEEIENDGDADFPSDGYAITTNKQVIKLLISNESSCCERWGYFMSEDDLESFVGAQLLDISITDTSLNTQKLEENDLTEESFFEGGIMFVNLQTGKGALQFVAYNAHNGYYGHYATVISEQLKHEEVI